MPTAYDNAFFSFVMDDSLRSARVVVPIVMQLLYPKSVIDVGCGPGAWLRAFVENGVGEIRGIDGDYVKRDELLIAPRDFVATDLNEGFRLDREYDLAVCVEVAEHLRESSGVPLINLLTSAAPAVLFSAAIPGQGGTNHVNEQWLRYWRDLFAQRHFRMIDFFRPRIRDDVRIAPYIRQNLVLFLSERAIASHAALGSIASDGCLPDGEWVYVALYEKWLGRARSELGVKEILSRLPGAIRRSIDRRLKKNPDY
jgi:SAM-dependent methyltransferase